MHQYRYILPWPMPISDTEIEWRDPETGIVWTVSAGNWRWDRYQAWLAEGNTPLQPGEDWVV
jgi:hypothetical protein